MELSRTQTGVSPGTLEWVGTSWRKDLSVLSQGSKVTLNIRTLVGILGERFWSRLEPSRVRKEQLWFQKRFDQLIDVDRVHLVLVLVLVP